MEDRNVIQDTGNFLAEKLNITSRGKIYDIKNFVLQTVIYEDIFSNVMTGSIVVRDAASLITRLALGGLEQVEISFKTNGFRQSITKKFYISSVSDRILGEKEQVYVLDLISVEGALDNVLRISKKFSGNTDDLVQTIFNEYLKQDKNLVVNPRHVTSASVVSPFWSPLKLINWLCNRSYQRAPNVLFFEGSQNFYLSSIENLMRQPVYGHYRYEPNANIAERRNAVRYENIQSISDISYFDVFKAQDYGYYTSKLITHDITLKQYKEFVHNQSDYKKEIHSLERNIPFPSKVLKNSDTYRSVRTKQYNMFEENKDPLFENWVMKRNSLMYEANNLNFVITVPGKTDMEVGKIIDVAIPKSISKDTETTRNQNDLLDPYLSGKYLVTSIRHQFTLEKHEMSLEILKDSFKESVE